CTRCALGVLSASACAPPAPPSFPTRRSSDLQLTRHPEGLGFAVNDGSMRDLGALAMLTHRDLDIAADGSFRLTLDDTPAAGRRKDRKSTRLNSSHVKISYAVFCLKKKTSVSN